MPGGAEDVEINGTTATGFVVDSWALPQSSAPVPSLLQTLREPTPPPRFKPFIKGTINFFPGFNFKAKYYGFFQCFNKINEQTNPLRPL